MSEMPNGAYGFLKAQGEGPMTIQESSEGAHSSPLNATSQAHRIGFSVEAYSPHSFQKGTNTLVISTTLAASPSSPNFSRGFTIIPLIYPTTIEESLLREVTCLISWPAKSHIQPCIIPDVP
ncbi:MAG: hypothetical protein QXJ75_05275 [Candidatus Bathyarchaeia archaeon]